MEMRLRFKKTVERRESEIGRDRESKRMRGKEKRLLKLIMLGKWHVSKRKRKQIGF